MSDMSAKTVFFLIALAPLRKISTFKGTLIIYIKFFIFQEQCIFIQNILPPFFVTPFGTN